MLRFYMNNKSAAVHLHTQFEEVEAITVIDLLRRAGIQTDVLSLESQLWIKGAHGIEIKCDLLLKDAKANYDIYIIPGGPGVDALLDNQAFIELVKSWGNKGCLIAAICAAPRILSTAKLLNGKKIACFPAVEASISEASISQDQVVKDGNIITSRGVGTSIPFALSIIGELQGEDKADYISKQIVFT